MNSREQIELLATGDAMLDREHKALAELICTVSVICQSPDRDIEIMRALSAMYLYAKEHFFTEEALMERVGYPDREHHAALHKGFLDKTHALADACLEGDLDFAELSGFLIDWLGRHVAEEDAKIMQFTQTQTLVES